MIYTHEMVFDKCGANKPITAFKMHNNTFIANYRYNYSLNTSICPHRGAQLLEHHSRDNTIVCPIHGWEFEKGNCKGNTLWRKVLLSTNGIIHDDGYKINWDLSPWMLKSATEFNPWYIESKSEFHGASKEAFMELLIDCEHIPFVHKDTFNLEYLDKQLIKNQVLQVFKDKSGDEGFWWYDFNGWGIDCGKTYMVIIHVEDDFVHTQRFCTYEDYTTDFLHGWEKVWKEDINAAAILSEGYNPLKPYKGTDEQVALYSSWLKRNEYTEKN